MRARVTAAWTAVATVALVVLVNPVPLPGAAPRPVVAVEAGLLDSRWAHTGALRAVRLRDPGLVADAWRDLDDPLIEFLPSSPMSGIAHVHWPLRMTLGQTLQVQGYANVWEPSIVRLRGPLSVGEVEASVSPQDRQFTLSLPIAAPGRHVVSLHLEAPTGEVLDGGRLPVSVEAPVPLVLWVRASSPSFEWQAFARWAGEGGAAVTVQTSIAAQREQTTSINRVEDDPPSLARTDVMLMDGRTWTRLDADERARLAQAVRDGLGVVVLADESLVDERNRIDVEPLLPPFERRAGGEEAISTNAWAASRAVGQPPPVRGSVIVLEVAADADVPRSDKGEALFSVATHGRGAIALVAVQEMFRWRTSGFSQAYGEFWREALESVARAAEGPRLRTPRWTQVDRRAALCIEGATLASLEVRQPDDAQGVDLVTLGAEATGVHCGYYWPRSTGWHTVRAGSAQGSFFVDDRETWPRVHARRARDASRVIAEHSRRALADVPHPPPRVPRMLMLLLFVAAAGVLWWHDTRVADRVGEERR